MSDAVLILGGGVAGLQAAIECVNAGARAIVVEQGPVIGGKLAAAITDEAGERIDDTAIPKLAAVAGEENMELITLGQLESIEGRPGNFTVSIREQARFVTDACTRCNHCRPVCPAVVSNEYDAGLTFRKAIYTPLPQTLPGEYVIDIASCLNTPPNYLPCDRCVAVCDDNAIDFTMPPHRLHERHVAAVILAAGFDMAEGESLKDLGYGVSPDVLTSAELQRQLEAPGPTGGFVARPSNEDYPGQVLLVLNELSPFSAYIAASQIRRLAEQAVQSSLLILAQRNTATGLDELEAAASGAGVEVSWGALHEIEPGDGDDLTVKYTDWSSGRLAQAQYDMIVLSSAVRPPPGLPELAATVGIELADSGYVAGAEDGGGVSTSHPGIFVAGCASGPKSVPESLAEARRAAAGALAQLDPRLLRPDYVSSLTPEAAPEEPEGLPETEKRSRIEHVLHALIKLGER